MVIHGDGFLHASIYSVHNNIPNHQEINVFLCYRGHIIPLSPYFPDLKLI